MASKGASSSWWAVVKEGGEVLEMSVTAVAVSLTPQPGSLITLFPSPKQLT